MNPNITRGGDFGGVMSYLVSTEQPKDTRKHHNVHTNPHVVAGSVGHGFSGALSKADARLLADELRVPIDVHGTVVKGGPVWHCSLSLSAAEGTLTDAKWQGIAQDFMKEMGFEDPAKAGCRWIAIDHGHSKGGNHHVHIVANLVREDGSRISTWMDMPKAQKAAIVIEHKHGLLTTATRLAAVGAGSVAYTQGESARAAETEKPVERVDLERRVRAVATTAQSEAEFVRLARSDGLLIRPFPAQGDVTGYSVGLPPPPGKTQLFFAGGKLARDLSLPRLKHLWPDNGGSRSAAMAEWRATTKTSAPAPVAPPVDVVQDELDLLSEQIQSGDPEAFAAASGELSGALAAASVAIEGDQPGHLARASRQVGAWSGTRRAVPPAKRGRTAGRGLGLLLLQAAMDPNGPIAQAVMRRQFMELLLALHQLHRSNRPTMASTGRGTTMHDPDGIDDAAEGLVTTGLTLSAAGMAQWMQNRAKAKEEGNVKTKTGFFDRFSLSQPERPAEFGEREADRLPRGLEGVIDPEEWRGMDPRQREQVDPDHLGRWSTDYFKGTPGATLPSTADQLERLSVLGEASGRQVIGADQMSRGVAAAQLRRLEDHLGEAATAAAYLDAGLVVRNGSAEHGFDFVFPADVRAATATEPGTIPVSLLDPDVDLGPVPEATDGPTTAPAVEDYRQLKWASADDPVTKAQAHRLAEMGLSAQEIGTLRKGWASVVIEKGLDGPAATRMAYEEAAAQMIAAQPVNAPRAGAEVPLQTPKPMQPPNRGHRM